MTAIEVDQKLQCYHCGQPCELDALFADEKPFCCAGCKTVYELLSAHNLCAYYSLDSQPGIPLKNSEVDNFAFLDEPAIRKKLLTFESPGFAKISFFIPAIHCVSCIWLLENLKTLHKGVLRAEVNFSKKTVALDFNPAAVSLGQLGALLASIGYAPQINLDSGKEATKTDNSLITKVAIAGFVFGNIMLFSFPEYLGLDSRDHALMQIFSWLNMALSWPVFFYSGWGYIQSAFKSFKQRQINIDVPIAAGLIALFARSHYDILSATGPGYLDSFTGLVFFLLIGRWFQSKTYETLSFERDFKSYFPLAVARLVGADWKPTVISELLPGDQIRIRNMEIIPADGVLEEEMAFIDYSFVTGEARPVKATIGELVYAGGRILGKPAQLMVQTLTSQSHLTSLWNKDAFRKRHESHYQRIIDKAAQKFTWIVLLFALGTGVYWYLTQPSYMWLVFTSVLMVACPCALALAAPFTYGSMLRTFGHHSFYLKNADVIERLAKVNAVVFDKTGTVTYHQNPNVRFNGHLMQAERNWVKTITNASTHPLSAIVTKYVDGKAHLPIEHFKELTGQGLEGEVEGHKIKIGSAAYAQVEPMAVPGASVVYVSIDDEPRGYFVVSLQVRENLKPMLNSLGARCEAVLSGDNAQDKNKMRVLFGCSVPILFNQSPHNKLDFIRNIQLNGKTVLMVGDGLNDAGALKQADVGIAVTDDTGVFTPACDGILQGSSLQHLHKLLAFARTSSLILKAGFGISFTYNAIALGIAASGALTPLVAAILMPISSASVVGFSVLAVRFAAYRNLKKA